jgi:hypothetical protein
MAIASDQVARDPLAADLDRPRVAFRTHGPCARETTRSPGAPSRMVSQAASFGRGASSRPRMADPVRDWLSDWEPQTRLVPWLHQR